MTRRRLLRSRWILLVLCGAVAALGQAPFDLWMVTVPALAAGLWLAASLSTARHLALAIWALGFGYFTVALHWIVEPFFVDAATHGWMAPFALVLLAGGMALFWGLAGGVAARVAPNGPGWRLAVLALAMIAAEWARATVLTGFPWAHPGHVLISSNLLVLAAWGGAHGLTALVLASAAGSAILLCKARSLLAVLPVLPIILGGVLWPVPDAPPAAADAPVIRLVQPNAPQHLKWLPEMIPVFFDRGLALAAAQVDPALGAPDLVIWPETSLPVLLGRSDVARAEISAAAGDADVLIGAQRYEGLRPRNSLALLDAEGRLGAVYDKHRLVPFGEYLPFGDLLDGWGLDGLAAILPGGYQPGPGPQILTLPGDLGRVFPMICYEAIFAAPIREVPRPDWMAHVTNDAWFGSFSGPYQHLALARLRAAEQGLPVLRAANTGISAVIDSRGQVVASLPLNVAGQLDARLPAALPTTVYARFGDIPVLIALFVLAAALLGGAWRHRSLPDRP